MTRRDYIRIAATLREARRAMPYPEDSAYAVRMGGTETERRAYGVGQSVAADYATRYIADMLAADNPRFDRGRFLAAVDGSGDPLTPDITRPDWAE